MRHRRLTLLATMLLAAPLLSAPPLHAQSWNLVPNTPNLRPTRDVVVEYQLMDADSPDETPRERTIAVNWAKGGALMRVQMAGERYYVVLNRDSDRMMMVLLDEHAYVDQPFDPRRQVGFSAPTDVPMVRGDGDVVAGNSCTLWHAKLGFGDGSLCITGDGVLLSAKGYNLDHRGDLAATSVIYGPQPATVFDPPAGFRKLAFTVPAATTAPTATIAPAAITPPANKPPTPNKPPPVRKP
jgi:hypothetical protein